MLLGERVATARNHREPRSVALDPAGIPVDGDEPVSRLALDTAEIGSVEYLMPAREAVLVLRHLAAIIRVRCYEMLWSPPERIIDGW